MKPSTYRKRPRGTEELRLNDGRYFSVQWGRINGLGDFRWGLTTRAVNIFNAFNNARSVCSTWAVSIDVAGTKRAIQVGDVKIINRECNDENLIFF